MCHKKKNSDIQTPYTDCYPNYQYKFYIQLFNIIEDNISFNVKKEDTIIINNTIKTLN